MTSPELIPGGIPLESVPGLNATQSGLFRDLWIYTAQQLVGIYGTNEPTRLRLSTALGLPRAELDGIVNGAQRLIPLTRNPVSVDLELEAAAGDYPLGALLEDPAVTANRMAGIPPYGAARRAALPECHSLLDQLPPLRTQGQRSTCVAHAVLAVREQLEIAAGAPADLDLSEQYVYWWCKERDGIPDRNGTYLSLGIRCLAETGAPLESLWPYVAQSTDTQGQGPPPAAAANGDPGFSISETQALNRTDITGMKACLAEGRSIAVAFPVFDSWFKSSAMARWGLITMPLIAEPPRDGHALAIVGYQDDADAPGGGYFLLRNSWQPWAWEGVWRTGYGYMPYAYVSRYASMVYSARPLARGQAFVRGDEVADYPGLMAGSPDVWLRRAPDGNLEPQEAVAGQENALYVRLHNSGPAYLYNIRGDIWHRSAVTRKLERASRFEVPYLKPGEILVGPISWSPSVSGAVELSVRIL